MDAVENINTDDIDQLPVTINEVTNDSWFWKRFNVFMLYFGKSLRYLE